MNNIYKLYKPFLHHIRGFIPYLLMVIILSIVVSLLGIIPPFIQQIIIDDAINNKDINLLLQLMLLYLGVNLISRILNIVKLYITKLTSERINFSVYFHFYHHVLKLPQKFFNNIPTSELTNRLNDTTVVYGILNIVIFDFLINLFRFIIYIIPCLLISPILSLILVASIPVFFYHGKWTGKVAKKIEAESFKKNAIKENEIREAITGIQVIKSFTVEGRVLRRIKYRLLDLRKFIVKTQLILKSLSISINFFSNILNSAIFFVSVIFIINKEMTIGQFFAFFALSQNVIGPILQITSVNKNLQQSSNALERMNDNYNQEEEHYDLNKNIIDLNIKRGEIKIKDVWFEFNPGEPVLKGLSLNIEAKKTIALVGKSGAGKSTIVNLITKFFMLENGTIEIDETDISNVSVKSIRNKVGFIIQNPYFFNGSILMNLTFGRKHLNKDEIIQACKQSNIWKYINSLPEGLNTIIGEKGTRLSGGQRQRLSIARALLRDPQILILDEATSSLDIENELIIQGALKNIMKNRTTIVIAHRLSTIREADKICFIDDGQVKETGTHKQLLRKKGFYYTLYKHSSKI